MGDDRERLERELKFLCSDLNAVKEELSSSDAERVAPSAFEENLVFDRQGELLRAGCLLRLRSDAHGARLTFKGPARFEEGVKVRVEHETRLEDVDAARRILESLGYAVERRYQKYREEWQLGGVRVALDHTPIGDYVEFEGEGAERLARRFGFEPRAAEPRNYLQLYTDYRGRHPEAPADMIFP